MGYKKTALLQPQSPCCFQLRDKAAGNVSGQKSIDAAEEASANENSRGVIAVGSVDKLRLRIDLDDMGIYAQAGQKAGDDMAHTAALLADDDDGIFHGDARDVGGMQAC